MTTDRLRLQEQAVGANVNTWGSRINDALDKIDSAIAGQSHIILTGTTHTLQSANFVEDEAGRAVLRFSGVPGGPVTVTAPGVEKTYWVVNDASQSVILTTGAGAAVTVPAGARGFVQTDGANFRQVSPWLRSDGRVIVADGIDAGDAATKGQVDAIAGTLMPAEAARNGAEAARDSAQGHQVSAWNAAQAAAQSAQDAAEIAGFDAALYLTADDIAATYARIDSVPLVAVTADMALAMGAIHDVDTTAALTLTLPADPVAGAWTAIRVDAVTAPPALTGGVIRIAGTTDTAWTIDQPATLLLVFDGAIWRA